MKAHDLTVTFSLKPLEQPTKGFYFASSKMFVFSNLLVRTT
nr:MAG TPA: hypothetical protein [Caudoviricetes sp.]